jgi:hypothetical protein
LGWWADWVEFHPSPSILCLSVFANVRGQNKGHPQTFCIDYAKRPFFVVDCGCPKLSQLLSLIGADVASQSFAADCANPNDNTFFGCAPGWQDMSLTFTALASSIDFTWTADLVKSPRSWEFGFDNIRLTQVPEPSTLALIGIGLVGMGIARRRKKV